ncbi:siderophore-interacting protein [Motilibacter aurantiacus]|uniref:siderophore-interacting protein n=1 Tax=Motilibacter aurantiacus TaxID=2714955 RepID=UPI00140DFF21|nr:siderophore-interacting protein [Motilibacter aurantiacus]NHC43886.1 siderophore-interacting protein [Motilibacter aurantiacus]
MHGLVVRKQQLTPSMVRIVLGGGGLDGFVMTEATDAYVNLAFAPEGAGYSGAFDCAQVRETRPREEWPARRRFTVRRWDEAERELTIDFVVHGDVGVAGRWAAAAQPGDVLVLEGPAGGYRPDPAAGWHLHVGDESALPAIAASLEALPAGARAVVRLVCDGPGHEVELPAAPGLDVAWLHRTGAASDVDLLLEALRGLDFPAGSTDAVHAFVHGEAEEIRAVRRHLLQRGVPRTAMSCSPYWRRTMTDEAWRRVKGDFVAAMEAEAS